MKKLIIAAIALSVSATSFAWGEKEQAALAGILIGGHIVNQMNRHEPQYQQPPVIVQQAPVIIQPPVIIERRVRLQPPVFDHRTNSFIYTPALKWSNTGQMWYQPSPVYIPANKHYAGCNFYDDREAWECIRYNERIENQYGR